MDVANLTRESVDALSPREREKVYEELRDYLDAEYRDCIGDRGAERVLARQARLRAMSGDPVALERDAREFQARVQMYDRLCDLKYRLAILTGRYDRRIPQPGQRHYDAYQLRLRERFKPVP